ncbi:EamA domain, partial [Dillenia turbinata]
MGSEGQGGCRTCCDVYNKVKPYILMVALQFGFAGMYIISLASLKNGLSRYVLIVYRNAVAAIVLAPFAFFFERPVVDQNLTYLGMQYTSASFASAIMNAVPGLTFIIAVLLRMERVKIKEVRSRAKIIGTIVTLGGALVMTMYKGPIIEFFWSSKSSHQADSSHASGSHWVAGTLLIMVGCCAWSCFYVLQVSALLGYLLMPIFSGMQSITVQSYPAELSLASLICCAGAAQSAVVAVVMERHPHAYSIGLDSRLLAPLYTGIVGSALAYYIQGLVLKTRGPVFVTAFNPLCMIIVSILGSIILAEQIHLGSIIGGTIIAFGLYSVVWGKGKDQTIDIEIPTGGRCEDHELPITNTNGSKLAAMDDKMGNQHTT